MECFNCKLIEGCKDTSLEKVKQKYVCHKWQPVEEQAEYQARIDGYYRFGDSIILALITREE